MTSRWMSATSGLRSSTKSALLRMGHYRRRLLRQPFDGVAVLNYHGVLESEKDEATVTVPPLHLAGREFDQHCRFIREACNPISLSQWIEAVNGGPPLPPRPVLITFDDGYRSVLTVAHKILSRYDIPAVAFIVTDAAERKELHWFDSVYRTNGEDAVEAMKKMPYEEWRVRARASTTRVEPDDPNAPLSVEEVQRLAHSGLVEIGAHSMSHPILDRADASVQAAEIGGSKQKLESWTGNPVRAFAYPNGDFNSETIQLVREAGYTCAFTTIEGFAPRACVSFEMRRFIILNVVGAAELAHRLTYSWRSANAPNEPSTESLRKKMARNARLFITMPNG